MRNKGKRHGTSQRGRAVSSNKRGRRARAALTNNASPTASQRITRSASLRLMGQDSCRVNENEKTSTLVIEIAGLNWLGLAKAHCARFRLEPGVDFPSLPTSTSVPSLKVVEELGAGATGYLCRAELCNANGPKRSYALKLVGGSRAGRGTANYYADLHKEYYNYSLLQLGKEDEEMGKVISRITPTCYGLYRLMGDSWFMLITEWGGDCIDDDWDIPEGGDKWSLLTTMTLFHCLGLNHSDLDEKNVVFDPETGLFKIIDLCESSWHVCRGLDHCLELDLKWGIINNLDVTPISPTTFQMRVMGEYKMTFRNLEDEIKKAGQVDLGYIGKSLKQFAEDYEDRLKRGEVDTPYNSMW